MPHKRQFGGEVASETLIEWLRRAMAAARKNKKARESFLRVTEIHRFLCKIEESQRKRGKDVTNQLLVTAELNKRLSRYSLAPNVERRPHRARPKRGVPDRGVFVNWQVASGPRGFIATFTDSRSGPGAPPREFDEAFAVLRLLELSALGYLNHIRTCKQCHRWFYAKRPNGKYCQVACQQKLFRSSEPFKQHKRDQAREGRLAQKSREEKERAISGIAPKPRKSASKQVGKM